MIQVWAKNNSHPLTPLVSANGIEAKHSSVYIQVRKSNIFYIVGLICWMLTVLSVHIFLFIHFCSNLSFIFQELCLSSEMETLLLYMSEDDPTSRCTLAQVFQVRGASFSYGFMVKA